jgi:serine/threonine protein kinase
MTSDSSNLDTQRDGRTPADSQPASAVPPLIPDHTLLRCIGHGSYGEVWLARNVMGTYRAVKIVHRSRFSDDAPYEREFSGIQRFEPVSRSHEGLVDVLQIGRNHQDGYFYYVMELADDSSAKVPVTADSPSIPNSSHSTSPDAAASPIANRKSEIANPSTYVPHTLSRHRFTKGALPAEECVKLGLSLASALSHLHENGLIHRDIKPLADVICASQLISETFHLENEGLQALDPLRQKRVDAALARARDLLEQAREFTGTGEYGKAVRSYLRSWSNTLDAIQIAGRSQSVKELARAL